jgi:fatty acid desaturase
MPGSASTSQGVADRIERIPDPAEPLPWLAWPTFGLFVIGLATWFGSSALAIAGVWPWPLSVLLNWLAAYLLFTVAHEAAHHTASTHDGLNRWVGRISTFFVGPIGFPVWRFVHMQHHRFVNVADADPDYRQSHSRGWERPLRWLTTDVEYLRFYLPRLGTRPRGEKLELVLTVAVFVVGFVLAAVAGWLVWFIVLVLLPARLNSLGLGWSFDYLPHCHLRSDRETSRFRSTRNRIGMERLLTPLTLYQNYHLVHHLHAVVPFYRYLAVWRRNERSYLEHDPVLSTVGGRPLTPAEYRRLRALEH